MEYAEIMNDALVIVGQRNASYGNIKMCMDRAATIASTITGLHVTPHDMALILHALKLARLGEDRANKEHYVDGINYLAFAGTLLPMTNANPLQPAPKG